MVSHLPSDRLPSDVITPEATGAIVALILGFMVFFIILAIISYIISSWALMTIAKKTKTPNGWLAWIPFANVYLMTQIAKIPWWTIFILFFSGVLFLFIPIIGIIIADVWSVWAYWKIFEARKKPGPLALLMILPVVNLIVLGIVAWKD